MKYSILILVFLSFVGCENQANRIEEQNADNGKLLIKNYFTNNSKLKTEVYDVKEKYLLRLYEFKDMQTTKIINYYKNGKIDFLANLIHKPNFFATKSYYENGKLKCEGSFIYDEKTGALLNTDLWFFYNRNTGEADSICTFYTFKQEVLLVQSEIPDKKNKEMITMKYYDIKEISKSKDSTSLQIKKIR